MAGSIQAASDYTIRWSTHPSTLQVIQELWVDLGAFFRRVRCLIGGALVDDVDYYNRVREMMHTRSTNNNRDNDDTEGFG